MIQQKYGLRKSTTRSCLLVKNPKATTFFFTTVDLVFKYFRSQRKHGLCKCQIKIYRHEVENIITNINCLVPYWAINKKVKISTNKDHTNIIYRTKDYVCLTMAMYFLYLTKLCGVKPPIRLLKKCQNYKKGTKNYFMKIVW